MQIPKLKAACWVGLMPDAFTMQIESPQFRVVREAYERGEETVTIGDVCLFFIPIINQQGGKTHAALGIPFIETTPEAMVFYAAGDFVPKFHREHVKMQKALRLLGVSQPSSMLSVFVTPEIIGPGTAEVQNVPLN